MIKNLVNYIINYISSNGLVIAKKIIIASAIFCFIFIIFNIIIRKIKYRIEINDIQGDSVYTKKIANLIGKILFLIGLIINILIVCEVIGIDVSLLMAGISLGIGFAMDKFISNIVAGFFIILNKKFKIGDFVEILGKFNTKGQVEEINLKHTIIRTIDKRRLLIPNTTMASTEIKTFKSEKIIRGDISIDLPRHINVEQVKKLLNDTINEDDRVLEKNYTQTYIKDFNEKGYKFNTIFFVNPAKGTPFVVGMKIKNNLLAKFKKYGIKIPYRHLVLEMS